MVSGDTRGMVSSTRPCTKCRRSLGYPVESTLRFTVSRIAHTLEVYLFFCGRSVQVNIGIGWLRHTLEGVVEIDVAAGIADLHQRETHGGNGYRPERHRIPRTTLEVRGLVRVAPRGTTHSHARLPTKDSLFSLGRIAVKSLSASIIVRLLMYAVVTTTATRALPIQTVIN